MISKIFITGKTFRETCSYVSQEQKQGIKQDPAGQKPEDPFKHAVVLYGEGVRRHDYQLMADDFETQHRFTPEKEKPVFHGMLSFPPGENPGDRTMVELACKYLQEIGMTRTQFAIVKHTDKEHLHMHIIANRVDNDGKIIGKGLIIQRGIKAAQKLTREYKLTPEHTKNLGKTNLDALHKPDAYRYRLYKAITEWLPNCRNLTDLEKGLLEQGISTRYRYDRQTGAPQGISFRIKQYCFQGSKVDPAYSLRKLTATLERQQQREQQLQLTNGKQYSEEQALLKLLRQGTDQDHKEQELDNSQEQERHYRLRHSL